MCVVFVYACGYINIYNVYGECVWYYVVLCGIMWRLPAPGSGDVNPRRACVLGLFFSLSLASRSFSPVCVVEFAELRASAGWSFQRLKSPDWSVFLAAQFASLGSSCMETTDEGLLFVGNSPIVTSRCVEATGWTNVVARRGWPPLGWLRPAGRIWLSGVVEAAWCRRSDSRGSSTSSKKRRRSRGKCSSPCPSGTIRYRMYRDLWEAHSVAFETNWIPGRSVPLIIPGQCIFICELGFRCVALSGPRRKLGLCLRSRCVLKALIMLMRAGDAYSEIDGGEAANTILV